MGPPEQKPCVCPFSRNGGGKEELDKERQKACGMEKRVWEYVSSAHKKIKKTLFESNRP